jgi:hypothetical protein
MALSQAYEHPLHYPELLLGLALAQEYPDLDASPDLPDLKGLCSGQPGLGTPGWNDFILRTPDHPSTIFGQAARATLQGPLTVGCEAYWKGLEGGVRGKGWETGSPTLSSQRVPGALWWSSRSATLRLSSTTSGH